MHSVHTMSEDHLVMGVLESCFTCLKVALYYERGGATPHRVSSGNFILGGKLTDHVAIISLRRGEGRLHNYILLAIF